jgi:hypothetical protein
MFVRVARWAMIVAMLATTGAHWALLQSVAWTEMLTQNLHSSSLHVAIQKTFDGKHPCAMCKAVASGQKSDQKPQFSFQSQKLEFPPLKKITVPTAPSRFLLLPIENFPAESFAQKPLLPPPRRFFV